MLRGKVINIRLRQEEEDKQDGNEVTRRKDVAVREVDLARDEGGGEADEEVEGPVGGGAEGDADAAVAGGVDLGGDGPGHWLYIIVSRDFLG